MQKSSGDVLVAVKSRPSTKPEPQATGGCEAQTMPSGHGSETQYSAANDNYQKTSIDGDEYESRYY